MKARSWSTWNLSRCGCYGSARARGCSVGALWREIVARALTQLEAEEDGAFVNPKTGVVYRPPANPKSIMDLAGMISDPYLRAEDIDDYLYGE